MISPLYRPRVYSASKTALFTYWRTLREDPDWAFVDWTASWILLPDAAISSDTPPAGTDFPTLWTQNFLEVKGSDFLLLYGGGDTSHRLRGALVEAGFALAHKIKVVTVGVPEEHSWTFHPLVTRLSTMVEARNHLYQFTTMVPPERGRKT